MTRLWINSILKDLFRPASICLLAFALTAHLFNVEEGEAYSLADNTTFVEGYKDILDRSVEALKSKRVRVRAGIYGYEGSKEELDFINTFRSEIKEYLKSRYDIEMLSFTAQFKPDIDGGEDRTTPRIELSLFLDETLSLPVERSQVVKDESLLPSAGVGTVEKVVAEKGELGNAGIKHYRKEKYGKVSKELVDAVIAEPDKVQARFNLGVAYQLQGRYREAVAEFQNILDMDDLPRAHIMLGAAYVMQGRHKESKDELKNVAFFGYNSWRVGRGGVKAVKEVAKVVKESPGGHPIRIDGHADNSGGVKYNGRLATKRAIFVATELVMNGVDPDSIFISGYSEFDPIATNAEKMGRRLNRRVEMIIKEHEEMD